MTCVTDLKAKPRLSAKRATGFALAALLVLGAGVTARAEDGRRDHWDHHEHHWTGGYYAAPPVVYGGGYYAPYAPPVVYGPGIGISVPGVNINIR
jgi:hypothetical protein